jgi:hypothetical protein
MCFTILFSLIFFLLSFMCGNGNLIVKWNNYLFLWRPVGGERTVKKLRLSKALTIPEGTTVSDACRRMAARRVNAALLTDANALLSGIVTDKVRFCLYC